MKDPMEENYCQYQKIEGKCADGIRNPCLGHPELSDCRVWIAYPLFDDSKKKIVFGSSLISAAQNCTTGYIFGGDFGSLCFDEVPKEEVEGLIERL